MSNQEYTPMAGDSRVLYHCSGCGSLVVSMARHDEWHGVIESQERRLEELLIAVVGG
jgi:hypothetical protein